MQSLNFFKALGAFASLLAFSDAAAVTTAGSVCTQEPYSPFLSLSQNYLAEAYCTSYYPQPTPAITSTMTITKSSISTVNVTSTLSVAYTTVNASAAVTKFTTIMPQAITTTVGTVTVTVSSNTSTSSRTLAGRSAAPNAAAAQLNALFSKVLALSFKSTFYSTLCSCIQTSHATQTIYVTSTKAVNSKTVKTVVVSPTSVITRASTITKTTTSAGAEPTTVRVTATTTVTASAVPTCSLVSVYNEAYGDYFNYTQYFAGKGVVENAANEGNVVTEQPAIYNNLTQIAYSADCDAIQACASLAAADDGVYYSFDVHYISTNATWICVQYYNSNTNATAFDVPVSYAAKVYGYSVNDGSM